MCNLILTIRLENLTTSISKFAKQSSKTKQNYSVEIKEMICVGNLATKERSILMSESAYASQIT